jgi:hypothetical protein
MRAINESFMQASSSKAMQGMTALTKTVILPGIALYRFASSTHYDLYYTGAWWVSYTPFSALQKYAAHWKQPLNQAARSCLAIDWAWSRLDVLIRVITCESLAAWSGTPKTQTIKKGTRYTGARWEPSRDITQLYVPGLGEPEPTGTGRKIWQRAFTLSTTTSL